MSASNGFGGVMECYAFKSRLQEYAQKAKFIAPVYETIREGPSHEPFFRSTVTVNGVRYDSLPDFHNRKTAEQSAAEIALLNINSSIVSQQVMYPAIPVPILHETGLCKNLLQEYAQKMNYAIPTYECSKVQVASVKNAFICRVDIGDISYIGAAAKSKKEAEIKAARTALLAIHSSSGYNEAYNFNQLTVLPVKRKSKEIVMKTKSPKSLKPKKSSFKNKMSRKKTNQKRLNKNSVEGVVHAKTDIEGQNVIGEKLESNGQVRLTDQNEKPVGAVPNECGSNCIPNDMENLPISSLCTLQSSGQIQNSENTQPTFVSNIGSDLESCPVIVNGNILEPDDSNEKQKDSTSVIPFPTSPQTTDMMHQSSVMAIPPFDDTQLCSLPDKEEKSLIGEVDAVLEEVPCDNILTGTSTHQTSAA